MQIPWRLKSSAFRILNRLPDGILYTAQRMTGRAVSEPTNISEHWEYHRQALERYGARRVIEFGAGKHLGQNLYLSTLGIEQTVVDLFPMLHIPAVNGYIRALHRMGILKKADPVTSLEDLKSGFRITYIAPLDVTNTPFADNHFDANITSSTLEHIPTDAIPAIFIELKRIIRPGGIISARNDYSDHYSHTDRNISEVNHLRFSSKDWERHSPPNHYQNRLRHGHFRKFATDAGFETINDNPRTPLAAWPHAVRPELLANDDADLNTRGDFIWKIPEK